jgi:hypothetical protein
MDKYGVVVQTTRPTSDEKSCPLCGAALDDGGACPKHGTEPFEKRRPDGADQAQGDQGQAGEGS